MNQLPYYFGDNTHKIQRHLRNRRRLQGIKGELERKRTGITQRILEYERKHESRLRVSRTRLQAAETVHRDAARLESECWKKYRSKCGFITGLLPCIGIVFLRFLKQQPSVEEHAAVANELQMEWATANHSLVNAKQELEGARTEFRNLSDRLESDRYAIQSFTQQLAQVTGQMRAEEVAVEQIITNTARNMSFRSLMRKQSVGLQVDKKFYIDVRRLGRLHKRLDALQPLTMLGQTPPPAKQQWEKLKASVDNSLDTRKLPLKCTIQLKVKGTLKDLNRVATPNSNGSGDVNNRRVFFGDSVKFKPVILQERWRSTAVAKYLTSSTLTTLSSSRGDAATREVENIAHRLDSEIQVLTRRLAKAIYAGLGS